MVYEAKTLTWDQNIESLMLGLKEKFEIERREIIHERKELRDRLAELQHENVIMRDQIIELRQALEVIFF
jgi:hypothetical protein